MAKPGHYALLLAINHYPGLTDLEGPENDAKAFKEWLLDPAGGDLDPAQIVCILSSDFPPAADPYDANPTDAALKKALNHWLRDADGWKDRVGERLYLFFAGHGFAAGSILDPALFTAQAQMGDPLHIPGYRYASKIQNGGFFDEIVLVMDCCQDVLKCAQVNDPLWSPPDRQRSCDVKFMQAFGAPRGRRAFEQPPGSGPIHGYFTSVFLEALKTAPHDGEGYVTARAVEETFVSLWNDRYLKETGYTPPIQPPRDLRLYRRNVPPPPMATPPAPSPAPSMPTGRVKVLTHMDMDLEELLTSPRHGDWQAGGDDAGWPAAGDLEPLPPPPEPKTVRCEAEDPCVHIRVFDGAGKTLREGFGLVEVVAAPGAYTARFRLGDQSVDHPFRVEAKGCPDPVKQGALAFSSPVPIPQTSSTHEYHYHPAEQLRGQPVEAGPDRALPGADATLMLFARDSAHRWGDTWAMAPEARAAWRLRRWGAGDEVPEALCWDVDVNAERATATLRLEVPAGTYLLGLDRSYRGETFRQELPVTVAPDWRTEIYVDSVEDPFTERRFDVEGASILVFPRQANRPDFLTNPGVRLAEIARIQLLEGMPASAAALEGWDPDPEDPMRTLYQAYAMTRAQKPNLDRLREFCGFLRNTWTARSVDVALLEAWCAHRENAGGHGPLRFEMEAVPMLARGWELLSELDGATPLSPAAQAQVAMWRVSSHLWTLTQVPGGARIPDPAEEAPRAVDLQRLAQALARPRPSLGTLQQAVRRALLDAFDEDGPGTCDEAFASIQRAFCVDADLMDRVLGDLWHTLGGEVVTA